MFSMPFCQNCSYLNVARNVLLNELHVSAWRNSGYLAIFNKLTSTVEKSAEAERARIWHSVAIMNRKYGL